MTHRSRPLSEGLPPQRIEPLRDQILAHIGERMATITTVHYPSRGP